VVPVDGGYRIESPCCSRNVDPKGAVIDIALIEFAAGYWRLYRRTQDRASWLLHASFTRLPQLLDVLNADTDREFWQ
jgi:hypothetical protein